MTRRAAISEATPLYPTESEIAKIVLGDRAKDWRGTAAVLERAGLPQIDPLMGGRYLPAVIAFFDRKHMIATDTPASTIDGMETFDAETTKSIAQKRQNVVVMDRTSKRP